MFDESILQSVAEAAKLSPGDLVLEIGPGTGGLTRFLLAAGAQVTAVEKDYALHDKLAEEYSTVSLQSCCCCCYHRCYSSYFYLCIRNAM